MRLHTLLSIISLCMGLTACGPDVFYIPIDNKLGNAKPISKTKDTIRVIVPERLTKYVAKARSDDPSWSEATDNALYIGLAKLSTEEQLQALSYQLTDTGRHSGGGVSKPLKWLDSKGNSQETMTKGGHPNVIVMVDSSVLKTYDQTYTWQEPIATDPTTGQPTMWDTKGQTVTMHLIEYKIKIVRPIGKDNPLFTCNNSSLTTDFCVYSQDNPSTYETIFEGYGTMDTNARDPAYIEDHLSSSVLYQYPTLLGKKRVFQISQPFFEVTKVTDAPSK